jgi:5-methylcytosine-specific restriction endonuclease McrA
MNRSRTLLLTSWYFPHKVIRWEDAVTMLFLGKVDSLIDYDEHIRSPSLLIAKPAVVRLRRSFGKTKRGVKFSRVNVFTRDGHRCQYCCRHFSASNLTFDHVQPRSCGGRTEWTNIVSACRPCNSKKGSRTPDESGMFPMNAPRRPKSLPLTPPRINVETAPNEWRDFLVTL